MTCTCRKPVQSIIERVVGCHTIAFPRDQTGNYQFVVSPAVTTCQLVLWYAPKKMSHKMMMLVGLVVVLLVGGLYPSATLYIMGLSCLKV